MTQQANVRRRLTRRDVARSAGVSAAATGYRATCGFRPEPDRTH